MRILLFYALFGYALVSALESVAQQEFSIVSWNIFQRPGILSDGQMRRIDSTAKVLLHTDADVLCLQEVFHKKARKRLVILLEEKYPYFAFGPRKKGWFKTNSGLVTFSKSPIESKMIETYRYAKGADAMAAKGFLKVTISRAGELVSIYNTHLQAGGDTIHAEIRSCQFKELAGYPLADTTNYWCVGDMNTPISDSVQFNTMIDLLKISVFETIDSELKCTANFSDNGLYPFGGGEPGRIDYVGMSKETTWKQKGLEISRPQALLRKKKSYLSDHALLKAVFIKN